MANKNLNAKIKVNSTKASSSKRFKNTITYIENYNDYHNALMNFKPVTYKLDSEPNKLRLGMIAEDVYEEMPIAAMKEIEPVYDITEEEAIEQGLERNVIDEVETGRVDDYEDRAIITMLIMEVQRLNNENNRLETKMNEILSKFN